MWTNSNEKHRVLSECTVNRRRDNERKINYECNWLGPSTLSVVKFNRSQVLSIKTGESMQGCNRIL